MNPDDVKEEIRQRCDIAEVIGSYLPLKHAGNTFKACCPFHKEKTPSFNVDPRKQIFHCFGCGEGGDVFSFVMKYEGVDFPTALRILGSKVGVEVENNPKAARDGIDKEDMLTVLEGMTAMYRKVLKSSRAKDAQAYLKERQLDGDIAEQFQIGYAPDLWDAGTKWADQKGYKVETLEKAGMLTRKEGSNKKPYDRFRDRIMFPLHNEYGRVVGFSGRVMNPEASPAKYINSPETLVFKKSRLLYGMDKARSQILEKRSAVLCEGQIDVVRCHQAGITHAVAALGTALTAEHAKLLKRYADEIIFVLDADTAGENAVMRAAENFLAAGLSMKVTALPAKEDPDTLILKQGADAFKALLDASQPLIDWQIAILLQREGNESDAALDRVTKKVLETISFVPSAAQKERMVNRCAELLKVSPEAIMSDLKKVPSRPPPREPKAPRSAPARKASSTPSIADLDNVYDNEMEYDPMGGMQGRHAAPAQKESSQMGPPPEELQLLELLVHHPETRGLCQAYIAKEHLLFPPSIILYEKLAEECTDAELLMPDLAQTESEAARFLHQLQNNWRSLGTENLSAVEAMQQAIMVLVKNHKEREREKADQELKQYQPQDEERKRLSQLGDSLTLDIYKLTATIRHSDWDKAKTLIGSNSESE